LRHDDDAMDDLHRHLFKAQDEIAARTR